MVHAGLMSLYVPLCVLMCPYVSLCALMCPYMCDKTRKRPMVHAGLSHHTLRLLETECVLYTMCSL